MDLAFVIISSIFQKEKYNLNNVSLYIEQNYKDFKYYDKYLRLTPSENTIYRFYTRNKDNNSKATLSILPAFVLSRKQKSIKIFFELINNYNENKISVEYLWKYFDKSNHFKSLTTLRNYFNILISQLDDLLKILTKKIVLLDTKNKYPDILPDETDITNKLRCLFILINQLLKILHKKKIELFLETEASYFLNYILFLEVEILLLNSS